MIISLRSLSYDDLKKQLSKEDKIIIWSCDTCIRFMGLGGFNNMKILEKMLTHDGYNVLKKELISVSCVPELIDDRLVDQEKKKVLDQATVIIVIACEEGWECVEEKFKGKKIIKTFKTVGVGNISENRGSLLTNPYDDIPLEPTAKGIPLKEVAQQLGLYDTFFDADIGKIPVDDLVEISINGKKYQCKRGENLLVACEEHGYKIPHLCFKECLKSVGACRLCLVKVEGMRGLVPSCTTTVAEGMNVITNDNELYKYRRMILELILAAHEHNCLFCPSNTKCELQDLIHQFGIDTIRYKLNKVLLPLDISSDAFILDPNRCLLCGRCIRTCEEVAGIHNFGFANRGAKTIVSAGLNQKIGDTDCVTCLACVYACPTGALYEKMYHYIGEDWIPTKIYGNYKK
jgi:ferredoxin